MSVVFRIEMFFLSRLVANANCELTVFLPFCDSFRLIVSLSLSVTPSSFTFRRSFRVFVRFSNIFFLWICFTSGKVQPQETGYNFRGSPSIYRLAATCNLFAYDHVHFLQRQESIAIAKATVINK